MNFSLVNLTLAALASVALFFGYKKYNGYRPQKSKTVQNKPVVNEPVKAEPQPVKAAVKKEENQNLDLVERAMQKHKNVVVLFGTSRCPYCVYLKPHYKKTKKAFVGKDVHFMEIQNDDEYAYKYDFETYPTVIYFKDGKIIKKHGSDDKRMTTKRMNTIINKIYFA